MLMNRKSTFRISLRPAARLNWLQRAAGLALLATLGVLGFFFLTVALAAGAMLAAVILLRFWWLRRKLRATAGAATYEGDYVVVQHIPETPQTPEQRGRPGPP